MRWTPFALAIAVSGCSFVLVEGPTQRVEVIHGDVDCTRSPVVPILDAAGGVALASAAVGGVIHEQTSSDGSPKNFSLYYAAPLVVGSIVYFIAASRGNNRVEWCGDLKERLATGEHPAPEVPLKTLDEEKTINGSPVKPAKRPASQANDEEDPNKKK
jgi:hypothetical protein